MMKQFLTPLTPVIPLNDFHPQSVDTILTSINIDRLTVSKYNHWTLIKNDWYYFKELKNPNQLFNELLGEKITTYFGLKSIHYEIASLQDPNSNETKYGLLSKNFREPQKRYYLARDLGIQQPYTIKELNDVKRYRPQLKLLIDQAKLLTIIDFYRGECDRFKYNLLIEKEQQFYELSKIHDYGCSFRPYLPTPKNDIINLLPNTPHELRILHRDPVIQEALDKIMTCKIETIVDQINDQYHLNIKKSFLQKYWEHTQHVKTTIQTKKLKKRKYNLW